MRHPTRVLIRHRTGNIRDHPQRYHINMGKRYTTGNFRKDFTSVAKEDKYYYVDGRRVSKKEFIDNWRKEGFYWIHDGEEYPVPPPNKYGMWQGKHRYSVTPKTQSGHYRIKGWKKIKDTDRVFRYKSNIRNEYVFGGKYHDKQLWEVRYKGGERQFKTKSEALKFAVDWMKKHPNGV